LRKKADEKKPDAKVFQIMRWWLTAGQRGHLQGDFALP
jgi:hypothetical protein